MQRFNEPFTCSTTEPGPKNAKLGKERTGARTSKEFDPPKLSNENSADSLPYIEVGLTMKEENDDLHANVGNSVLMVRDNPVLKLMS